MNCHMAALQLSPYSLTKHDNAAIAHRVKAPISLEVHPDLSAIGNHDVLVKNRPAYDSVLADADPRHEHAALHIGPRSDGNT